MTALISLYCGNNCRTPIALDELVALAERRRVMRRKAFDEKRLRLIAAVADDLLKDKSMTAEPPVRVFAFWTRKAALLSMQRDFEARLPQGCQAFGRGLAFHLPPANVDTLFLYSWAVACLTGNASLVRLPSQMPTIVQRVIDNYLWRAEEQDYADLFVSYPVDDAVSAALSAVADVRLVWGGDAKVALFHGWPVRLGGKTLAFPDRRSFAVLSGDALTRLEPAGRTSLAQRMHRDVFVFDQMACASPQALFVVGDPAHHQAGVAAFLKALDAVAHSGDSQVAPAHAIHKFVQSCEMAVVGEADRIDRLSANLTVAYAAPAATYRVRRIGGGFLTVRYIASIGDLVDHIEARDQTVTHFGIREDELASLIDRAGARGMSRLVPVGQALNFDTVWDGYNLLGELVRLVRLHSEKPEPLKSC